MKNAIITIIKIYLVSILLGVIQKLIFMAVYVSQTANIGSWGVVEVLWNGMRLDISTAGYITALPMLAVLLGVWGGWLIPNLYWKRGLKYYLAIISLITAVISAVDLNLYGYWGYRIDATLLPYLATPTEAAASISIIDVVMGVAMLCTIFFIAMRLYSWAVVGFEMRKISLKYRSYDTILLILAAGGLFVGIRGGVEESVANVSKVYFSPYAFANHAAVNPTFSLLSSMGEAKRYDEMYNVFGAEELAEKFAEARGEKSVQQYDPEVVSSNLPDIAIVIWEGFTRDILEMEVDGREVMPHLKKIAQEGLFFENMYATGSRTDRGVAGVLSGFPSQPKISIMKIPSKSRNLPSIASSLVERGYRSTFYYGGDLNFMDMSSYLYGTGWQKLLWGSDFASREAESMQWGHSDGMMCEIFADSLIEMTKRPEPTLATLLTLSSHQPFDVPEQMGFSDPLINSMAYCDAKIGEMVEKLEGSAAWDNLLLMIVADHTIAYSHDVEYNAPNRHRIPMIWSGGALAKRGVEQQFLNQTDIAPTLLGSLGVDIEDFIFGENIFGDNASPRFGYYTFNDGFGVVDSLGCVVYDNVSQMSSRSTPQESMVHGVTTDATPLNDHEQRLLNRGKAILQQTHLWIEQN